MSDKLLFQLLDSPTALARCRGWTEEVYHDLLAGRAGRLSQAELDAKYVHRKAILALDMTGFTINCLGRHRGHALLRILDVQRICVPALQDGGAVLVRAFADDLVALFDTPGAALDAAFEIHRRMAAFNGSALATEQPAECCIGIGYGEVYAIGVNLAMGDEMNRAAKLGEDIAHGTETLVTTGVYEALRERSDLCFDPLTRDDMLFPCFRATRTG
jgi:adenylate cyclase